MVLARSAATLAFISAFAAPFSALGQAADMSPTLLVESLPSDNPDYRRMILVRYLSGDRVTAAYKAYNRTEFIQIAPALPAQDVLTCTQSGGSTLAQIRDFETAEARRQTSGQTPEQRSFCIKNVPNWEAGAKKTWLDPIFDGLPHAAILNN
jgi:hypothetical protein